MIVHVRRERSCAYTNWTHPDLEIYILAFKSPEFIGKKVKSRHGPSAIPAEVIYDRYRDVSMKLW